MADKEKKKKPKKKEEGDAPEPAADAKSPQGSVRASSRGSKKAKRSGSSVFSMFSQKQLAEFKEGFAIMDNDKDGIIGKADLRHAFDLVGRIVSEKDLDAMLAEVPGPINFTQLLQLFGSKMSGGGGQADDEEVIVKAFRAFDNGLGKIDGDKFRTTLKKYGDKFTDKEVDDAYEHFYIDDKGFIDLDSLINMVTGGGDEEGEES